VFSSAAKNYMLLAIHPIPSADQLTHIDSMISLKNQHVFVVGGSRGIGAGAATVAAKAGARVSITYRAEASAANAVLSAIKDAGSEGMAVQADVQNETELSEAFASAVKRFGSPRGVVISAGVFEHRTIEEMTLDFWNRVIGINLTGTMLSVKAAAKHMRAAKAGGSIVIYTSTAGQSGGGGGASAYCTSKAGQIIFMRSMAHELAADKIRVNCIAPAWTETDMAAPSFQKLGYENIRKAFPLGRIGKVDDVANATLFLLSNLAEFITGTTVTVDGGMAMRG
jgi:NAD(P)-dependent dehydrogenase (short-subunit alcohol dehydrogenase family)